MSSGADPSRFLDTIAPANKLTRSATDKPNRFTRRHRQIDVSFDTITFGMHDSVEDSTSAQADHSEDVVILNQLIDDEEGGTFRIKLGDTVGYLTIAVGIFDEDTMCRPYLLIPKLPDFPTTPWTKMRLEPDVEPGTFRTTVNNEPLPELQGNWHSNHVDVLSLERIKRHRSNVHETIYQGQLAVAKIAAFEWDMPRIENETWAYWVLSEYRDRHLDKDQPPCPQFLGHLTENGRRMGMLLEKKEGERASVADLESCEEALRQFHQAGLVHGDVNRYNFVVNKDGGGTFLVDLEHAEDYDGEKARAEIESLPSELSEDTGRGDTVVLPAP